MDATKIGTFIAAERRAKGWTQRQLAGELQLFQFDVDAIILRVVGAVVFWWIGRIPAVKKLLVRLF